MSQRFRSPRSPMESVGWLFADLFLALAMLFLLANTVYTPPIPVPPPALTVSPTNLEPMSRQCRGGTANPQCIVTVKETITSIDNITWTASSDMSDTVTFNPRSGTLSPGKSVTVAISVFPCQNGSFIFSGSRDAIPVTVYWRCTPPQKPPERLELQPHRFTINIDPNGLLTGSKSAIDAVKQQVRAQGILRGRNVGLIIAYGGAPGNANIQTAQKIADKIYNIFLDLGKHDSTFSRASRYDSLYNLGGISSIVTVDVFLFAR